jgi:hypothetical protein
MASVLLFHYSVKKSSNMMKIAVNKFILFTFSLLLVLSTPTVAQDVATISQTELESVYTTLTKDPPSSLTPNTLEHKATRWTQYKEEKGTAAIPYSTWSSTYNNNMTRATKAREVELAYMNSIGWGKPQQTIKIGTQTRRLDIADIGLKRAVEVKSYEGGTVYATPDIKNEVSMDAQLVKIGWQVEWAFKACKPSAPLRTLLTDSKITVKEVP